MSALQMMGGKEERLYKEKILFHKSTRKQGTPTEQKKKLRGIRFVIKHNTWHLRDTTNRN